jgi:Starch-binding associating with outer membrane
MKNIIRNLITPIALLFLNSCDKGFDELNTNETLATAINPVFILNTASSNCSYTTSSISYDASIVQQMITPNEGVIAGANFNQNIPFVTVQTWQKYYRTVVRHTQDVIAQTKDQPTRSNLYNMSRILQAYAYMVLTDTYGDIPYTDAAKGYPNLITSPKYDSQQSIYAGIIKELTEATAALDANKTIETADILYGGNILNWRKFGNSLLLRAGMRLSEVDAAQAKQIVSKVAQNPLIETNAENGMIKHDALYLNPLGNLLNATEAANFYLAAPFVDYLKRTADPRLSAIAVRYVGAKSGSEQIASRANSVASAQVGMPFGFNNSTISTEVAKNGFASFYEFTQADRTRVTKNTAPSFLVTASQTQLLLAEAAQRGWISGTPAATYFSRGIRLNMEQMAQNDVRSTVAEADIATYLAKTPLVTATALEQINDQYWIASFLNGHEAFANFRRSGFPRLTPNPFSGKSIKGQFINRLSYPDTEVSVNKANLDAAIANQKLNGADDLDTKVWWDK